jgi:hypothetical protein
VVNLLNKNKMKKLIPVVFLFIAVSCNMRKDQLVYNEFESVLYNSKSWQEVIQNNNNIDSLELVRLFFKYNELPSKTYSRILFYQNFYKLSDSDIDRVKLRQLFEKKTELISMFYSCDCKTNISFDDLYKIEIEIYNELLKMETLIK